MGWDYDARRIFRRVEDEEGRGVELMGDLFFLVNGW